MPLPGGIKDQITHVSLPVGSRVLMVSDRGPGFGPPLGAGNDFSIPVAVDLRPSAVHTRPASFRSRRPAESFPRALAGAASIDD